MGAYVALLRGINVSGHNLIRMSELKMALAPLKFTSLSTYLQSGNLIFETDQCETLELQASIEKVIKEVFSLEIRVKVIAGREFSRIFLDNPFVRSGNAETKYLYYIFLSEDVDRALFSEIQRGDGVQERMELIGEVIYMLYPNGYGRSRLNNNFFERKLKVSATARNHNTVSKLNEMLLNL